MKSVKIKSQEDAAWLHLLFRKAGIARVPVRKRFDPDYLGALRNWVSQWTHIAVDPKPRQRNSFESVSGAVNMGETLVSDDYWRWN